MNENICIQEFGKGQKRHFKLVGMKQAGGTGAGLAGCPFWDGCWSLSPQQSLLCVCDKM